MTSVSKLFGRLRACDKVDLEVAKGATHAIVGENGAGKTTLMRVLYGVYRADEGSMEVHAKPAQFRSPREAIAAGVGMVSQHYSVIPELTCIDNLMLGDEPATSGIIRRAEAIARADELAKRMGFEFDWPRRAERISPAACQKLEILKLLWRKADVLILDEPTAMLSPPDADALFNNLRRLADEGKTIILVTHRLREVMDYCDRVTVLRAGRKVGECDTVETSADKLTAWIVGEDARPRVGPAQRTVSHPLVSTEAGLEIRDLVALGDRGDRAVAGATLQAQTGQIAGVAGVDGNGQTELFEALMGLRKVESGTVSLAGEDITHGSAAERIARGLRFIPADRHRHGAIEAWSVEDNAILGLQRLAPFNRNGLLDPKARRTAAVEEIAAFAVKTDSPDQPVSDLSGGNQQRLVVARALHQQPRVLIAFQPSRGLDIRGASAVFEATRDACERGAAALVVSFDLDELMERCDPIFVMRGGRIVARLSGAEIDRDRIGRLMVGAEESLA